MHPGSMMEVIGGRQYATDTAQIVAHNAYWDGSNHERGGRNTYLYKTAKGSFFLVHLSQWQGERDSIEPLPDQAGQTARDWWDKLSEHAMTYEEAFGEAPEEA